MKHRLAYLITVLLVVDLPAQTGPDTYWVAFTDKENTPYSIDQPEQFLSARAIERRNAQGIAVDELDLPVDPQYIQTVLGQGQVDLLHRSKWLNGISIRSTDEAALSAIAQLPFVLAVRGTRSDVRDLPRPSKFLVATTRDGEPESYGPSFRQIEMLGGDHLHAAGALGEGMLIGVMDSGFEGVDSALAFQELRARGGIIHTRDLVAFDEDVYADHSHGRSVLSCLAGHLDGQLLGSAPAADYVLIRSEDVGSEYPIEEDNWVAGAELADSLGCDVINTSLGYTTFDDSTMDHSYADMDGQTLRISIAANIAARKGMIPVQSAGNSGESDWRFIGAPADAIDILAVGAVGAFEEHAPFSSHGPSADGRVKPDVCAMGWGAIILRSDTDSIIAANGTSFSAPILAGLVACLWQLHPDRNAHEVMDAVRRSASLFLEPNDTLGYGVPDLWAADAWLSLTSVEGASFDAIWAVFPNPFDDRISIEVPQDPSGAAHLALFDAQGRLRRFSRVPAGLQTVDLPELEPGAYLLKLQVSDRTMAWRIIKE